VVMMPSELLNRSPMVLEVKTGQSEVKSLIYFTSYSDQLVVFVGSFFLNRLKFAKGAKKCAGRAYEKKENTNHLKQYNP